MLYMSEQGEHILPIRLNAALLLAADLATEERDGQFDALSLMPSGMVNDLVRNELLYLDQRASNLGVAGRGSSSTTWFLPDWKLTLDFALFDEHWNNALRTQKTSAQRPAFMASAFLWGVLAVEQRNQRPISPSHLNQTDWAGLASAIVVEAATLEQKAQRSEQEEVFLNWLMSRAFLLAAPESGLPAPDANQLLSAWLTALKSYPDSFQERMRTAVRSSRRVRADRINTLGMSKEDFLADVDVHFPHHQWGIMVDKRMDPSKSLLKQVEKELSEVDIQYRDRGSLSEPRTLLKYAEELEVDIQVSPVVAESMKKRLKNYLGIGYSARMPHVLIGIWQSLMDQAGTPEGFERQQLKLSEAGDEVIVQLPERLRGATHPLP